MSETYNVELSPDSIPHSAFSNCIHPGARFVGSQLSKGKRYNIEVMIQNTNPHEKTFCGFLTTEHLTKEVPNLTLFFEAEVISKKFPFITGKWNASIETDISHWNELHVASKFPDYYKEGFDYSILETSDHVFIRLKEKCLVPGTNSNLVDNISFSGFYYIWLRKKTGCIVGYYYHVKSERFQLLDLKYVPTSTYAAFQMR